MNTLTISEPSMSKLRFGLVLVLMVECRNCQRNNSVDSTFCRGCGHPLDEADVMAACEQIERAVAGGYTQYNDGNVDSAIGIALKCLEWDRNSSSAASLLAMCYERKGQVADALKSYERVLELNPNSALDKIKVEQLRSRLGERKKLAIDFSGDKPKLIAAACALGFLILGLGYSFTNRGPKADARVAENMPAVTSEPAPTLKPVTDSGAGQPQQQPVTQTPAQANVPPTTNTVMPVQGLANTQPTDNPTDTATKSETVLQPEKTLKKKPESVYDPGEPDNREGDDPVPSNPQPKRPEVVAIRDPEPVHPTIAVRPPHVQQDRTPKSDPDPTPVGSGPSTTTQPQPAKDPAVMEITNVSPRKKPTTPNGSEPVISAKNKVVVLMQAGAESYQAGNYARAAKSFEGVIGSGGETAKVRYRLAQSYERLGKRTDAAKSYRRAADLYSAQMKNSANKERLKNLVEVCQSSAKLMEE